MLGAESVDHVAIRVLRARPRRPECGAGEIAHGQGVQGTRPDAVGADWRGLSGKCLLIGRHKFGRPGQTGQGYFLEPGASEIPTRLAVTVDEAIAVLRRSPHYT